MYNQPMKKKHKADFESINPYHNDAPLFVRVEHLARYRWAREMLRRKKAKRVMDIACADGYGTDNLFIDGRYVLGVDRDSQLVEEASSNYNNCDFIICDIDNEAEVLEEKAPFDAICCFETLEHLRYPKKALELFYRMMGKGGHLLISIPDGKYEPIDSDGNIISDFHLHAFSYDEISAMLNDSGFWIVEILHQHLSAKLHKNFNTLIRDRDITKEEFENFFPKDKRSLDLMSEVFAWPDEIKGNSYSTIFLCTKS